MTRQVNLNSQTLLPGYGPVQLPTFIATVCIAIVLGAGWFYYGWSQKNALLKEEQQWLIALEKEIGALNNFQAEHPNTNNEPELIIQNEDLTTQLRIARETYSGLANQLENAIEGFHGPLTQLADYDLNGLWLTHISLKDGKRFFSMNGFARKPELIPQYLEQLGDSTFGGLSIQQLAVKKELKTNLWGFTLANHPTTLSEEAQ